MKRVTLWRIILIAVSVWFHSSPHKVRRIAVASETAAVLDVALPVVQAFVFIHYTVYLPCNSRNLVGRRRIPDEMRGKTPYCRAFVAILIFHIAFRQVFNFSLRCIARMPIRCYVLLALARWLTPENSSMLRIILTVVRSSLDIV